MANREILYSRDLLYTTDSIFEPGSIHMDILSMDKISKIPVLIESKTKHSPLKHMDSVIKVIQDEVFDRILVDVRKNVNLYIKVNEDMGKEYRGINFVKVIFDKNNIKFKTVDEIEL